MTDNLERETGLSEMTKVERQLEETLKERDEAEEAFSQAYYLITGRSPNWSSQFGFPQALQDIDDAQTLLRKAARPAAVEAEVVEAASSDALQAARLYLGWYDGDVEASTDTAFDFAAEACRALLSLTSSAPASEG